MERNANPAIFEGRIAMRLREEKETPMIAPSDTVLTAPPTIPLLMITFPRGTVRYMPDFSVWFDGGPWWPREVGLAYELIGRYKDFDKEFNRPGRKGTE